MRVSAESVLAFAGALKQLSPEMIRQLIASGQLTEGQVQAALATNILTEEEKEAIRAKIGDAGATTGAAGATKLFDFSLKGLIATMRAFIVAHPMLAFFSAVAAVIGVAALAVNTFTVSAKKQAEIFSELDTEYQNVASELSSVESELQTVKDRIEELNTLAKTAELTPDQQDELTQLGKLNTELERELAVKQKLAEIAKNDREDAAYKSIQKTTYKSITGTTQETVSYEGVVVKEAATLSGSEMINDLLDGMEQVKQKQAELDQGVLDGTITREEYNRQVAELDETNSRYETRLAEVIAEQQQWANAIDDTSGPMYEAKQRILEAIDRFLGLDNAVVGASGAVEKFSVQAESFESICSKLNSGIEAISTAQEDMAETGYLSADSVKALKEAGLDEYLIACEGGYKLATGALNDYVEAQRTHYANAISDAISAGQDLIDSNLLQAQGYDVATMSIYDQIKAMEKLAAAKQIQVANEFIQRRLDQGDTLSEANRMLSSNDEYRNAYDSWLGLANVLKGVSTAERNLAEFERAYSTTKRDFTKTNTTDANKSEFEEEYAKQKHALELGKKTLKEFNDWLDGNDGYKKYFSDRTKYADEWRKYEKEVFDNSMQLHEQEATNLDHTIEMLKLQGKSEQDILEAYRKKQILLETARDLVYDFLKAQGLSEEQIKSNSTFQELNKALLENPNEAKDFSQERVNQNVADFEHEINMLERVEGKENELIAKYREEQAYLVAVREEYRKTLVAAGKTAEEIAKDDWFQALTEQIHDVNDAIDDVFQDVFDRISGDLNELLDLTKELIQHEKEEQIEALEDQKDA